MFDFPAGKHDLLISLISQQSDYLVLLCNADNKIIAWHKQVEEQLGYCASDVLGKDLNEILPEEGPSKSTRWVRTKDKEKILMSSVMLDITDAAGNLAGAACILRSVAAQRSSGFNSRALVGALEHSNVLIRRWNGVIEHWTEGCERLYGFTAEEATGKVLNDLLHTEYPISPDQIQDCLGRNGSWRGELKQRRKDGAPVFVAAQMVTLQPSHDELLPLIVSTHSDITSRLEMQHELESANARLKRMAEELERSNEELEEFARIASHDLGAPITSTRWLVEILTLRHGTQLDAEGQRALAQVAVSLERMSELVEAVLTHAKLGTSAIATFDEADTELALEVALENLRRDVTTTGATVTSDTLPPLLIGQQLLTQLFQNLLSNAIKYRRPNASPRIHVAAEQSGALWRVSVKDNGMGIETEWFERIFLPMQRRHGSKIAGSGIGLATCRKIVNRAGGRIWVESEIGEGSTFFFTLPGSAAVAKEADEA